MNKTATYYINRFGSKELAIRCIIEKIDLLLELSPPMVFKTFEHRKEYNHLMSVKKEIEKL